MILNRTLDTIMPVYRETFAKFDLTEQQWRVLRVIWSSNDVTSAQLSQRTLLSAPSLVSIIDRLERKELVSRVRSEGDRRQVFIVATQNGQKLQQEIGPIVSQIHEKIRASISGEEWSTMEKILAKIQIAPDRED